LANYDERHGNDYSNFIRTTFSNEDSKKDTDTKLYWSVYKRYYENFGGEAKEETPLFDPLREF